LASLLWRLRRATTIETGLFEIQADQLHRLRRDRQDRQAPREVVYALFGRVETGGIDRDPALPDVTRRAESVAGSVPNSIEKPSVDPAAELTRCFLRLTNLPDYALDRLSRYEATLWQPDRSSSLLMP
jgi:hypothetical protein